MDLLSGITEGVGSKVQPLIGDLVKHLTEILRFLPIAEVQQSAFALLSDLIKKCFQHVVPFLCNVYILLLQADVSLLIFFKYFLADILCSLEVVIKTETCPRVCSNAILVLGEVALKLGITLSSNTT